VLFSPQHYDTSNPGSPSTGAFGGSNPSQVGLGAQVSAIQQNFNQGELQSTGVASDLGIDGNGFFIIKNSGNQQLYTRDGAFSLNDQHQLVDSGGDFVQGYGVNAQFQIVPGKLTNITVPLGQETIAKATQNASLTGVLNSGGVVSNDASILTTQALQDSANASVTGTSLLTNLQNFGGATNLFNVGDTLTLSPTQGGKTLPSQTFVVAAGSTVSDLQTFFSDGLAIDPAPPAGTPGPTPGATIANAVGGGQQLLFTGNVGSVNKISIAAGALTDSAGTAPLTFNDTGGATGEGTQTSILAYDSLGNPITLNVNTALVSQSTSGTTWDFTVSSPDNVGVTPFLSSGTLSFDNSGQLSGSTNNTITINRTGTGATASQQITLNFGGVQALSSGQASTLVSQSQDGFAIGTLDSYAIGTDGTITGSFSNGLSETIGQVAMANFNNADGLVNQGNNLYAAGADSGAAIITTPGNEGTGLIRAGELEQSNVDLSQEFINLIIASTGYSASSRVISTSDQLLTQLLNSTH
jgi:flagellar hook protein FlgE